MHIKAHQSHHVHGPGRPDPYEGPANDILTMQAQSIWRLNRPIHEHGPYKAQSISWTWVMQAQSLWRASLVLSDLPPVLSSLPERTEDQACLSREGICWLGRGSWWREWQWRLLAGSNPWRRERFDSYPSSFETKPHIKESEKYVFSVFFKHIFYRFEASVHLIPMVFLNICFENQMNFDPILLISFGHYSFCLNCSFSLFLWKIPIFRAIYLLSWFILFKLQFIEKIRPFFIFRGIHLWPFWSLRSSYLRDYSGLLKDLALKSTWIQSPVDPFCSCNLSTKNPWSFCLNCICFIFIYHDL